MGKKNRIYKGRFYLSEALRKENGLMDCVLITSDGKGRVELSDLQQTIADIDYVDLWEEGKRVFAKAVMKNGEQFETYFQNFFLS